MNFLNKCILKMYCLDRCKNYEYCKDANTFEKEECSVSEFIKWLNENGHDIGDLIKANK